MRCDNRIPTISFVVGDLVGLFRTKEIIVSIGHLHERSDRSEHRVSTVNLPEDVVHQLSIELLFSDQLLSLLLILLRAVVASIDACEQVRRRLLPERIRRLLQHAEEFSAIVFLDLSDLLLELLQELWIGL